MGIRKLIALNPRNVMHVGDRDILLVIVHNKIRGVGIGKHPAIKGGALKCTHCGKSGHTIERCYLRMQDMGAATQHLNLMHLNL